MVRLFVGLVLVFVNLSAHAQCDYEAFQKEISQIQTMRSEIEQAEKAWVTRNGGTVVYGLIVSSALLTAGGSMALLIGAFSFRTAVAASVSDFLIQVGFGSYLTSLTGLAVGSILTLTQVEYAALLDNLSEAEKQFYHKVDEAGCDSEELEH